jgi:hypothetical protein
MNSKSRGAEHTMLPKELPTSAEVKKSRFLAPFFASVSTCLNVWNSVANIGYQIYS